MNKGIMVVKIGTAVLSKQSGRLDEAYIRSLAGQVYKLKALGYKIILVSSGAIGAGMDALGLTRRPAQLSKLQACAAIGQGRLMKLYEEHFRRRGTHAVGLPLWLHPVPGRSSQNARTTMRTNVVGVSSSTSRPRHSAMRKGRSSATYSAGSGS